MGLPNSERSRAVLIGTSNYAGDSGYASLPSVAMNLKSLEQFLFSRTGLEHVEVAIDPSDEDHIYHPLDRAVKEAEDLLLFYFAGHGVAIENDLGLTLTRSQAAHPSRRNVRYSAIRKVIGESRARVRMVILDCCHSGKAFGANTLGAESRDEQLKELAVISGAYVLTATDTKTKFASADGTGGHTAFTGSLIDVLSVGERSGAEYLTMSRVYPLLRAKLQGANQPTPKCSGADTAAELALTRNPAVTRNQTRVPAAIRDHQIDDDDAAGVTDIDPGMPVGHDVRQARYSDLEPIASIERERFADQGYNLFMLLPLYSLHGMNWSVLEVDGAVRGYVMVAEVSGRAWILSLAVSPGDVGRGYERIILEHALACWREFGVIAVSVTIHPDNWPTRNFYTSAGFLLAAHDDRYYGIPESPRDVLEYPLYH